MGTVDTDQTRMMPRVLAGRKVQVDFVTQQFISSNLIPHFSSVKL